MPSNSDCHCPTCLENLSTGTCRCLNPSSQAPAAPKLATVDGFITDTRCNSEGEIYARWVLMLLRLPEKIRLQFKKHVEPYQLFCTYRGVRYRVISCSNLYDVWLETYGRLQCVSIGDCSQWSSTQ
jgi:hypothetical protein